MRTLRLMMLAMLLGCSTITSDRPTARLTGQDPLDLTVAVANLGDGTSEAVFAQALDAAGTRLR